MQIAAGACYVALSLPVFMLGPAVLVTLYTIGSRLPRRNAVMFLLAAEVALVLLQLPAAAGISTALAVLTDTLASISLLTNYVGNARGWGVTVPLYAIAILTTATLPRWIGWLGMVVAVFGGWLGLLSPVSEVIEAITTIGFLGFFVFMVSMGITLLRSRKPDPGGDRGLDGGIGPPPQ